VFPTGYRHYLRTAASLQWNERALDLGADAAAWPELPAALRGRLQLLVAGFCVGEERVATELTPFSDAATSEEVTACFKLQQRDEARHARFFDRVGDEVMHLPGASSTERGRRLRAELSPAFLELFERRLPAVANGLAAGAESLGTAVALYHLLLEGVVFTAGQLAVLDLLDGVPLPGLRTGVELVLRDERWHIGFGAHLLDDLGAGGEALAAILGEADAGLAAWGQALSSDVRERVLEIHRRRLGAANVAGARRAEQDGVLPAGRAHTGAKPMEPNRAEGVVEVADT